jgi:hypothetical protein
MSAEGLWKVLVKRRKGSFVVVVAAQALAFLFIAPSLLAQQTTESQAVKQEVPNNLAQPAPPEQPIPYSHKKHLTLGLQCQFCHTNPDPGNQMTFPATSTCMQCHGTIAKEKPTIRKLAQFANTQEPVPWVRVYVVLSGVNWSHRKHLDAGMKCEMCHGQVAQMDVMAEVTGVTSMTSCINCHQMNNAKTACKTCHRWP